RALLLCVAMNRDVSVVSIHPRRQRHPPAVSQRFKARGGAAEELEGALFPGGPRLCLGVGEAGEGVGVSGHAVEAVPGEEPIERREGIAVEVGKGEEVVPGHEGAEPAAEGAREAALPGGEPAKALAVGDADGEETAGTQE